jgi:hypothetical protein
MQCGLHKKNESPCEEMLDPEGLCRLHCRGLLRACWACEYRYPKEQGDLRACPQCGKSRFCPNRHIKGRVRCAKHGGKSRAGLSSPRLTDGRQSRYLDVLQPKERKAYQKAQDGENLLSLEEDIALLDYRVRMLLAGTGGRNLWKEVRQTFEEFASAQAALDRAASVTALQKLASLIRQGEDESKLWQEIGNLSWKQRPRLVLSETRRKGHIKELVQTVLVLDALRFVAESVRRNVTDEIALDNINADIRRAVAGTLQQLPATGKDDGDED